MHFFESKQSDEITPKKERAKQFYRDMIQRLEGVGGQLSQTINVINDAVGDGDVIVRREHPLKVFQSIAHREPLEIHPDGELNYANAVEWRPTKGSLGLANAFTEGFGEYEGLVTVIGFKKNQGMEVVYPFGLPSYERGTERDLIRSVKGKVFIDDLRFIIFRIPADRFPLEEMTLGESEKYQDWLYEAKSLRKPYNIFRAVTFSRAENKNDPLRHGLAA